MSDRTHFSVRLERVSPWPVIKVVLRRGGTSETLVFAVDTGSPYTFVRKSVLVKLNGGRALEREDRRIDELTLGEATLVNVPVVPEDDETEDSARRRDGLIGLDVLRAFDRVTFDFKKGDLLLDRGASPPPDKDALSFSFKWDDDGHITVPVQLRYRKAGDTEDAPPLAEPLKLEAMIDTGAPLTTAQLILVAPDLLEGAQRRDESLPLIMHGMIQEAPVWETGGFLLGTTHLPKVKIAFMHMMPMNHMMLIGTELLSRFRVTLDFRKERLLLDPPKQ